MAWWLAVIEKEMLSDTNTSSTHTHVRNVGLYRVIHTLVSMSMSVFRTLAQSISILTGTSLCKNITFLTVYSAHPS